MKLYGRCTALLHFAASAQCTVLTCSTARSRALRARHITHAMVRHEQGERGCNKGQEEEEKEEVVVVEEEEGSTHRRLRTRHR